MSTGLVKPSLGLPAALTARRAIPSLPRGADTAPGAEKTTMASTFRIPLAAAALALTLAASPALAQEEGGEELPSEGWWIVLAARATDGESAPFDPAFDAHVRTCGVDPFGDFSAKFEGFSPGVVVVVHMVPFPTKAAAAPMLEAARRCVPDAYLKWGRYAGE